MKGLPTIETQAKGPFYRRKRGQKMAEIFNGEWAIKGIEPTAGKIEFQGSKGGVKLVFDLKTVDLIACDSEGNQATFRLFGFQLP